MSQIDDVQHNLDKQFSQLGGASYLRLLDTPHVWGMGFGKQIMPAARARQADFERALIEVMQKARYRCDLASLNSPDPDWVRPILGALDTALSERRNRSAPTQFRFLFGQTPAALTGGEPTDYADFKAALVRLVRMRGAAWERMPEFWLGRFFRIQDGIISALQAKVFGADILDSDDTKLTWNHAKIVVADGCEALVGGHNLNMDLFRSYPPVHDASVVMHGPAAYGAQLFLDRMWACGTDLLTKETLDTAGLAWKNGDADRGKPADPLQAQPVAAWMAQAQAALVHMHQTGAQAGAPEAPPAPPMPPAPDMRGQDLRALLEATQDVFPLRFAYTRYDRFGEYRQATRVLSVGKYWTGPSLATDFQRGSEIMKQTLILGAKKKICMSQMDLVSAWKKNWSDHTVCQWLMQALRANPALEVQVVVSPLDAGAGAAGDQYSFGSGASRTFALMKYYMLHDVATDAPLDDHDGARANALKRLHVAPFFYTDQMPPSSTGEGETYKWPALSQAGFTATLKQLPLSSQPPKAGVIGSAAWSVINASGYIYKKVPSAPGNHAKIMIVDDQAYVVGSDNLYPGNLSEFNYLVEGAEAVKDLLDNYWTPLWRYSGPHAISG